MSSALTRPVWTLPGDPTEGFDQGAPPERVDVAIVGAGIAGLAIALQMARDGRQIVVFDRQGLGQGETLRTTAHLSSALDEGFVSLARWHGAEGAALARSSHAAAIDWIEHFVGRDGCGFKRVPSYLFTTEGRGKGLHEERAAAQAAGLRATVLKRGIVGFPSLGPALHFADQGRVDMSALIVQLRTEAMLLGVRFQLGEVTSVEGGSPCRLELERRHECHARTVVLATNVPFHDGMAIHTKQAAYRTYAIAGWVPRGALPDALIYDDADPYHYVRLSDDGDHPDRQWVILGGEDHKTGQPEDGEAHQRLRDWAHDRLGLTVEPTFAWSGQVLEPADGLAFIGRDPDGMENVYIVTGDSGHGVTHGVIAGMLIADLVAGRRNDWARLYDPQRRVRHAGEWLKENANAALAFADWLRPGDIADVAELPPGHGAIVRRGIRRLAVFRNPDGTVETFSARCPHMGCSVSWSAPEKSWDCPCHGSRFDGCTGAVLNGPATSPLERVKGEGD